MKKKRSLTTAAIEGNPTFCEMVQLAWARNPADRRNYLRGLFAGDEPGSERWTEGQFLMELCTHYD